MEVDSGNTIKLLQSSRKLVNQYDHASDTESCDSADQVRLVRRPPRQSRNSARLKYNDAADSESSDSYDQGRLVQRPTRRSIEPVVHYGTIASGNEVMWHGGTRDQPRQNPDASCFEMEAAGLMSEFPCLVVREVCDYADSHKSNQWQGYAAAAAATYAKQFLEGHPREELRYEELEWYRVLASRKAGVG